MYFNRTLNDWAKFDINKRTKFDAAISSGLAIMACNRHLYTPRENREINNIRDLKNTITEDLLKNNIINMAEQIQKLLFLVNS